MSAEEQLARAMQSIRDLQDQLRRCNQTNADLIRQRASRIAQGAEGTANTTNQAQIAEQLRLLQETPVERAPQLSDTEVRMLEQYPNRNPEELLRQYRDLREVPVDHPFVRPLPLDTEIPIGNSGAIALPNGDVRLPDGTIVRASVSPPWD